VWVNGHEWAKRQATAEGLAFTELANEFASCDDPAALQAICDRLGPADLQCFFDRWMARDLGVGLMCVMRPTAWYAAGR